MRIHPLNIFIAIIICLVSGCKLLPGSMQSNEEKLDAQTSVLLEYEVQFDESVHNAPDDTDIKKGQESTVTDTLNIIRERVASLKVSAYRVNQRGARGIVVRLPELSPEELARAKALISRSAKLEFKMVDDLGADAFFSSFKPDLPSGFALQRSPNASVSLKSQDKEALLTFLQPKVDPEHAVGVQFHPVYKDPTTRKELDSAASYWESFYLFNEAHLTSEYLEKAEARFDPKYSSFYVALTFDARGAKLFAELTAKSVGMRVAIIVDDEVLIAPVINTPINEGKAMVTLPQTGNTEQQKRDVEDLAIVLGHGALPARIELKNQRVVEP